MASVTPPSTPPCRKRDRGLSSPTKLTPVKPKKKIYIDQGSWTPEQDNALLEFIEKKKKDGIVKVEWPASKGVLWTEASKTVSKVNELSIRTGTWFYDLEDHHHLLKRVGFTTRQGGPHDLNMEAFTEILSDPESGLTDAALRGDHKQNVREAEILLSHHVASSLKKHGYTNESEYVQKIANWHEAHDGRAIKTTGKFHSKVARQRARSRANYEMLNYLLDDYMPWHREHYDFRLIDVNRSLKGIRGMTRETIIAKFTNIEAKEHRRRQLHLPPAHPRAYDTNDSEMLFSMFREHNNGLACTLKRFQYTWAPLCSEFLKKLDVDLPFFYETTNQRFKSGELEAPEGTFDDDEEGNPLRLHTLKTRRRDSSALFIAGRATLPITGSRTIRTQYHNLPSELPRVRDDHDYYS